MLSGVKILEVEALGPGPFTGMLLADLGAEVTIIHRKGGKVPQGMPEASILDRGKKSIALDLKDPTDIKIFKALVARSDALIEGFRPGVMERLGLGPQDCHAENPALVYGRMTGWGQTGPLSQQAGHDLNYIAMSGALWYASPAGEVPFPPPTLVGDIGGGAMYLAVGILSGILKARGTGKGCVVDAAIQDGSAHMMNLLLSMRQTGMLNSGRGTSLLDGPHWSRCYRTSDGGYMSVQCLEPQFYAIFLQVLGLEDDPKFRTQLEKAHWPALTQELSAIFATRSKEEWTALFEGTDACVAPVLSPEEALAHPVNQTRASWHEVDGVLQTAPAPRFDGKADWTPPPIPARDAHRDEILAALAQDEI